MSSLSRRKASSMTRMCPSWIGLKLPPKRPIRMPRADAGSSVFPVIRAVALPLTSGPELSVAADAILEAGQLFDANRTARMHLAGRNADLAAETEFAAIGKLG
jgi:hypothetical protein